MIEGLVAFVKRWGTYLFFTIIVAGALGMRNQIVPFVRQNLVFILMAVLILIIVILIFLVFFLRRARKKPPPAEAPDAQPEDPYVLPEDQAAAPAAESTAPLVTMAKLTSGRLRRIFARAHRTLKANIVSPDYRYQIPWILMLRPPGREPDAIKDRAKSNILAQAQFKLPFGAPIGDGAAAASECNVWFFGGGVVVDTAGDMVLQQDGYSSDKRLWSLLLQQLQKYRPERPIDGVVVAIPCEDFLGDAAGEASGISEVRRKAELLKTKLYQTQKTLGVRFPVYLVVTGCDQIEGFQSFCLNLPKDLSDNIFGWSSPYSVNIAYHEDWIPKAFQSINRELVGNQFEMYAGNPLLHDSDGLFVFAENLKKIEAGLQIYADQLFSQNVYQDAYVFRGLYICGDSGIDKLHEVAPKTFFLQDLFNEKVFPEFCLARPLIHTLVSRNKAVIAAQVVAGVILVLGAAGLYFGYNRLQSDVRAIVPVFEMIDQDLLALRNVEHTAPGTANGDAVIRTSGSFDFEESAENLFKGMANLRYMTHPLIPSAWFSNLEDDLNISLGLAFDNIILKAMYAETIQKGKAIFRTATADTDGYESETAELLAVDQTPEFKKLRTFVRDLQQFEKHAGYYNSLTASETNLKALGSLAKYLFDLEMPKEFYKDARHYSGGLGKTGFREISPSLFSLKTREFAVRKTTAALYRRLFADNIIEATLQRLGRILDRFGNERRKPDSEMRLIHEILKTIDNAEKVLHFPQYAWIFNDEFDLGEPFEEVLTVIEESQYLGEEMKDQVVGDGQSAFDKLQTELRKKRSQLTGRLLALKGELTPAEDAGGHLEEPATGPVMSNAGFFADFEGADIVDINEPDDPIGAAGESEEDDDEAAAELSAEAEGAEEGIANELSSEVLVLRTELKRLLALSFMGGDMAAQQAFDLPPGTRLRWDYNLLNEAVQLFEPFNNYKQTGAKNLPVYLQRPMEELARTNLNRKVLDLIQRAQDFVTVNVDFSGRMQESDILVEIRDFNRSSDLLNALLNNFNELDLVKSYQLLSDFLYWQSGSLLEAFNDYFEQEDLYGIRNGDFSWWDGQSLPGFGAFDMSDERELENYLRFQRERIEYLAKQYGQPLVRFFRNNRILRQRGEETILFRWERILAELKKFKSKKPKNSVALLEKFILSDMNEITILNYHEKIGKLSQGPLAVHSGDIFLRRRKKIAQLLYGRCEALIAVNTHREYQAVQTFFNEHLAGKYPFAKISSKSLTAEADPDDIKSFYYLFDQGLDALHQGLKTRGQFGKNIKRARRFIEKMADVQQFFKTYLGSGDKAKDAEKGLADELPAIDFNVEFRVNRQHERTANRIIDWKLVVGDKTFRNQTAIHEGRWRYGDPVMLGIRWAKNAPDQPVFAGKRPGVKVAGRTVTYNFDNKWSLMRLIREHAGAPGDFDRLADPKPHTLKIWIDAKRKEGKPSEKEPFKTWAYYRIMLSAAQKEKLALKMPSFPVYAPTLKLKVEKS